MQRGGSVTRASSITKRSQTCRSEHGREGKRGNDGGFSMVQKIRKQVAADLDVPPLEGRAAQFSKSWTNGNARQRPVVAPKSTTRSTRLSLGFVPTTAPPGQGRMYPDRTKINHKNKRSLRPSPSSRVRCPPRSPHSPARQLRLSLSPRSNKRPDLSFSILQKIRAEKKKLAAPNTIYLGLRLRLSARVLFLRHLSPCLSRFRGGHLRIGAPLQQ